MFYTTPGPECYREAVRNPVTSYPGTIAGAEPAIEVVDSSWQGGRKLASFEILREEGGEQDRRFVVRLHHPVAPREKSPEEEEVPYRVIGKGPTWVYREEDYARVLNMDNGPVEKASKNAKDRRR